jgi:DNA-binding PadR family transcriptional regulator
MRRGAQSGSARSRRRALRARLLSAFGERSGYDLKKHAEAGVGYVWTAAKSQIYAVLPRLVEGGYATLGRCEQSSRPTSRSTGSRQGRGGVPAWLEEPVEERPDSRSTFLLKIFFGRHMSREALVGHLERKREWALTYLDEYRGIEERDPRRGVVVLRVRDASVGHRACGGVDRWADEILRELESGREAALAILAVALVAAPAADGYRNPTAARPSSCRSPACTGEGEAEHRLPAVAEAADGRLPPAEGARPPAGRLSSPGPRLAGAARRSGGRS